MILIDSGERYGREVRVIPVDFSDGQSVYADIQAEISDLDVAVLGETSDLKCFVRCGFVCLFVCLFTSDVVFV